MQDHAPADPCLCLMLVASVSDTHHAYMPALPRTFRQTSHRQLGCVMSFSYMQNTLCVILLSLDHRVQKHFQTRIPPEALPRLL